MRAATTLLCLTLGLLPPLPLQAQETPPDETQGEAPSLMEEGAKMLLRGLMQEMEPAISEIDRAFREIGPKLEEWGPQLERLVELAGDLKNYAPPEILPNGDIILRRKIPLLPPELTPKGEIEL